MQTFVARQPIFDRRREVYGYELLFRSGLDETAFRCDDGAAATRHVISHTLFSLGIERVLCGKRAFVNFEKSLLSEDICRNFPPGSLVIEILETVEVDEAVIEACRKLQQDGFTIALDDFEPGSAASALLPLVTMVKVDIQATPREKQEKLLRDRALEHVIFLAEKVETHEQFEWSRHLGYELFQGHFFEKPTTLTGNSLNSMKMVCLELLRETAAGEIDCKRTAAIIERDVALSFKLLSYVNSALFHFPARVESIEHAVALLGPSGLLPWAAVAAIPSLASDKPPELAVQALVRAQFSGRLARMAGLGEQGAFLIGLFSHLDAMLNLPLAEAVEKAGMSDNLTAVLLEHETALPALKSVYDLVRCYEAADWAAVTERAAALGLDPAAIGRTYSDATFWTAQVLHFTERRKDHRARRRYPLSGSMQVMCEDPDGTQQTIRATVQNISETGMQLRVPEKIPPRSMVLCRDAKLKVAGRGIVRYCRVAQGKYVVGIDFSGGTGWADPLRQKNNGLS